MLGVLVTLATGSLLVGVATFAIGRDVAADRIPPAAVAAQEGIEYVIEDSARVIASARVAEVPGAALDFITFQTSQGRCFDVVLTHRGSQGSGGGCGGDGTTLLESGVGITSVLVGKQRFTIISGLLDAMPEARFVEADLPSGATVRMGIGPSGVFHWAVPSTRGEDPAFLVSEFRVVSKSGDVLDVIAGPPSDVHRSDLPVESVEGESEPAG